MIHIWRRDFLSFFYAPIAVVVGVLFLASQGASFWAVVQVLSDPRQPAPIAAVLSSHFAGSQIYFSGAFVMVAVITMRLVAEERRSGTWETLLTAPIGDLGVILGKWLAAVSFYLVLWLPTLAFVLIVDVFSSAGVDWATVASTYLGVAVSGAAFCSLGLALSAATDNQIVAATATYACLGALLFVGELGSILDIDPDGAFAEVVNVVGIRGHLSAFARGELSAVAVLFLLVLAVVGLVLAYASIARGRRHRNVVQRRFIVASLVMIIGAEVMALVSAHPVSLDVSDQRFNQLQQASLDRLAAVADDVDVLLVHPTDQAFAPVFGQAEVVAQRLFAAQPRLHRQSLDPAQDPERVNQLAAQFGIAPEQLGQGGAVVFAAQGRRRIVEILDMASFDIDELGAGRIAELRAERAFISAIAEVTIADRPTLCLSRGHGEPRTELEHTPWSEVIDRLQVEGVVAETVAAFESIPRRCRALAVIEPVVALSATEVAAVNAYLTSGGRALVAMSPPVAQVQSGLRLLLEERGVEFTGALVVDPSAAMELPMAWATVDGYGDHAISMPMQSRRYTIWQQPGELRLAAQSGWSALVSSSSYGWAETNVTDYRRTGVAAADENDRLGNAVIAAAWAGQHHSRLVVVAANILPGQISGLGWSNQYFAYRALGWLLDRVSDPAVSTRVPKATRLVLTKIQRLMIGLICIGVIPGLFASLGVLIWWRRRRE